MTTRRNLGLRSFLLFLITRRRVLSAPLFFYSFPFELGRGFPFPSVARSAAGSTGDVSFSSLIAMARTSKSMLNINGEYGHFVFFLISEEMLSIFTTENVCCEFAVYGLYYVEVGSFCAHFLERFWGFF